MNSPDFEHFSDGEWDDRGELAWNEFDWQQYLKQNEKEIARFLALYHQHRPHPEHLDRVAHLMGWSNEEWKPSEEAPGDVLPPPEPAPAAAIESEDAEEDADPTSDTYTIHKHPVFIATRGLHQHIYVVWEHFLASGNDLTVNPSLAWKFAASLHAGELNAIMGIQALDLGDFALTICHLKNALGAVNHSLSMLHLLPLNTGTVHVQFFRDIQGVLFDLRELWLRVMNDCREECRRRAAGEHEENE